MAMKMRKLIAMLMVIILPLGSYLIVNNLSKDAVMMPKRYFYDTVLSVNRDGKTMPDTQWHKVKPFKLTNQFGKEVSLRLGPGDPPATVFTGKITALEAEYLADGGSRLRRSLPDPPPPQCGRAMSRARSRL